MTKSKLHSVFKAYAYARYFWAAVIKVSKVYTGILTTQTATS